MSYAHLSQSLQSQPRTWLVTGAAGFIGSNLVEALLKLDQTVVGLDNFATGHRANLDDVRQGVSSTRWDRFRLVEGDITDLETCLQSMQGVDVVLHQAALGSVPRSIENPLATNAANIDGFLTMLVAAGKTNVKRFVYAASSSTYGDHPDLPKLEDRIGKPLSPYAVTKYVNELYADVFARTYGLETIGLRYFNVFGPRQDPKGAYAAVIPLWFDQLLRGEPCHINGDGETSRDFCFVDNAVQANILAAVTDNAEAVNKVYNVAYGARTTLNQLFYHMRDLVAAEHPIARSAEPVYRPFREGDVRHSQADISRARTLLGYQPSHSPMAGLSETAHWFLQRCGQPQSSSRSGVVNEGAGGKTVTPD